MSAQGQRAAPTANGRLDGLQEESGAVTSGSGPGPSGSGIVEQQRSDQDVGDRAAVTTGERITAAAGAAPIARYDCQWCLHQWDNQGGSLEWRCPVGSLDWAIQAKVQRQLGSLLDRLQLAEENNSALRAQLDLAQQSLEQARAMGTRPPEIAQRQLEQRGAMDTTVQVMQHELPGFLRSILGNPRQRSESPVPPKAASTQAPESPMMDAELQAVALAKGQSAGSDLVKPGTTSLNPLPEVTNGADTALLFQDWLEVTSDVLKRLQNPLEFAATDNLGVLGVLRAWPRWMARCEAVRMSPPDASVLARGLKLLTSRYIEAAPDANFRTAMLRTSLRLDGQPTMDNLYAYQRHLQAEVETLIASQPRAVPAAEQPRLRALDKPQSPKGKDKEKDKDKSTADLCRYFSMATLDREARNEKCLLCGSEGHRRRECTVGQSTPKAGTTTAPQQRGQRAIADKEPAAGVSTMSTTATAGSMDTASTASSIQGTPWTLEALVQAAQQVVATQGSPSREDRSPEKTKLEVRMKDIRISSMTTTSALLDSGATHSLRSARDMDEWDQASEVVVQLAGNDVLTMRMSDTGSLLMPPRSTPSPGGESSNQGQTIVPSASWSRLWAIRWRGLPRGNEHRRAAALEYQRWLPSAMRGRGSFANRKIGRQEEGAPRELYGGDNGQGVFGGYADGERLEEQIQEYVGTGSMEAGYRSVRDAAFLQDLPGECLDGLIQPNIREDGWKIMKAVDFLTRPQKRRLWTARRWVIHLFAGSPGHWQVFQLDQGSTVVLELDVHRCGGHDILSSPTWRLLLWGAITGRIDAVVGGPPGRGGLTGTKALRAITRMLWLYSVADVARGESKLNQKRPVAFMLEHPSQDSARRESLWTTQMWQQFQEEMDVPQVTFNPAAMGGETGSTTIGTNIYYLMGLQDLGVEGVEGESSQQGCKSPVWPPGFVDALVKALQFWDRRPICTPMLAKMSAEQWRRHVQSNHADYHRDCLTCVMAKGRGRRHARVHHPHMFTLTIDLAGPVKPGLDVSSKGALGKNLKYLLVARDVLPTEYVKGYTGTEPPGDHGLNKHGLEPENSAGKELARPSPLPPRDEGVLAEEELPVTAEKVTGVLYNMIQVTGVHMAMKFEIDNLAYIEAVQIYPMVMETQGSQRESLANLGVYTHSSGDFQEECGNVNQ
ncbi:hypothetical protein AK812_SmicGene402 [Symbiodinium microadriaticum]|uniref:Uncharacterized protein n=1 Tax=Symbiodinium microadriaticum TaxID=2951 RepID=A0A1Q9F6K1_SYMMI|nr:hypothetical protein AK812_SmicGene402 [Symbiodinium microadriaticum]CAE7202038.1 unnamed protein product [Symbiodinium sp. KB8]CAE7865962.1 unnamed protein product [Symbiodinium microadriaticum]